MNKDAPAFVPSFLLTQGRPEPRRDCNEGSFAGTGGDVDDLDFDDVFVEHLGAFALTASAAGLQASVADDVIVVEDEGFLETVTSTVETLSSPVVETVQEHHHIDEEERVVVSSFSDTAPLHATGSDLRSGASADAERRVVRCGSVEVGHDGVVDSTQSAGNVCLDDFELLKVIGRGAFGKVYLVCSKHDRDKLFAMKVLKKGFMIRTKNVKESKAERTVLTRVRHPFSVSLHFAFQNESSLHLVMDYCFPVSDHQLLTSEGWMFFEEVHARMQADARQVSKLTPSLAGVSPDVRESAVHVAARSPLLLASYDATCDTLVYEKPEHLVHNKISEDFVEFSHRSTMGSSTPLDDYFSVLATPEHEMYASLGREEDIGEISMGNYRKVRAAKISQLGDHSVVRLLASAGNGLANASTDIARNSSYLKSDCGDLSQVVQVLGLTTRGEVEAFLWIYGFWLAGGSLITDGLTDVVVKLPQVKQFEKHTLIGRLREAGLQRARDWEYAVQSNSTFVSIYLSKPEWTGYFAGQYGHKYSLKGSFFTEAVAGVRPDAMMVVDSLQSLRYARFVAGFASQTPPRLPDGKWFWNWVQRLDAGFARVLLRGYCFVDDDGVSVLDGRLEDGGVIFSSSVQFRDQLSVLLLHAGFSSYFTRESFAREGSAVDRWRVIFHRNAPPLLRTSRNEISPTRRKGEASWCVRMPSGFVMVRRAVRDVATGLVTHAALPIIAGNCGGGQLFYHLREQAMLPEAWVQYYVAEIALALEHLHALGIIHRDVKPENVLLTSDGHICLTDYGFAKEGLLSASSDTSTDSPHAKTNTFCGTLCYMAPEVIKNGGEGYSVEADWWSLGILAFDMLTGNPPWFSKNEAVLQKKILNDRLRFPKYLSGEAVSLLKGLINRNPAKRLGSHEAGGALALKRHAFFHGINWVKLLARELPPPFTPELSSSFDTRNFDPEFTDEPLVHSPSSPVSRSQDSLFQGFSYTRSLSLSKS